MAKKKIRGNVFVLLVLIAVCQLLMAASAYCAFQDIGIGARPMGMGRAFIAIADDANAAFWNPAGLTQIKQSELSTMYSLLYPGLTEDKLGYNFIGFVQPITQFGTLGLSYTSLNANLYRETVINLSYGKKIREDISAGINIKSMAKNYGTNAYTAIDPVFANKTSASGIGIDIGLLYKYSKFSVGLCGENLNEPDISLQTTDKVPSDLKLGAAYRLEENSIIGLDIAKYNNVNKDMRINTGAESWFLKNKLGARVGFGMGNNKYSSVSLGGSYKILNSKLQLQIDYAFEYLLNGLMAEAGDGNHRIATTLRF